MVWEVGVVWEAWVECPLVESLVVWEDSEAVWVDLIDSVVEAWVVVLIDSEVDSEVWVVDSDVPDSTVSIASEAALEAAWEVDMVVWVVASEVEWEVAHWEC